MRIALVYDGVYPHSVGGGEKIFHDLARHLGRRHEVVVLGLKLWEGPRELRPAPGVRLVGICAPDTRNAVQAEASRSLVQALRFARATYRALRELGPFDIVDCMATPYFPLYAAWFQTRGGGTTLVSTWLELWERAHWRAYLGSTAKARVACWIERGAIRLPRHIISISPQTSESLVRAGLPPSRLTTITPWADLDEVPSIPPDPLHVDFLFAGRLIQSKGVALLIRAMAILCETYSARCRIIGDGPERVPLERLRDELGLGERVIFSGFVAGHADVIAAMKSSGTFVLPSNREGFGIVVVEAGACGVPCVTLDVPNNAARHLVRESGAGRVCNETPEALASAMAAQLERDEATRVADGARCRRWAEAYGWPARARAYEEAYLKAVGHG